MPIGTGMIERLRTLDSAEPFWHWMVGRFQYRDAETAWLDRRIEKAYYELDEALKSLDGVDPQYNDREIDFTRVRCHILSGMAAARIGDTEVADMHLDKLNLGFEQWSQSGKNPSENTLFSRHLGFGQLCIYEALEDWPKTELMARELLKSTESRFTSKELEIKQQVHEILYGPGPVVAPNQAPGGRVLHSPLGGVGLPSLGAKSIAVLPFKYPSENESDRCYTDGIHDGLLTELACIRDNTTNARTSVMGYRNTSKTAKEIGQELGVSSIVEGEWHYQNEPVWPQAEI